jgi:cyanate permease
MGEKRGFILLAVVVPLVAIVVFLLTRPGPVGWYLLDLNWLWLAYKYSQRGQRIFCLCCFALLTVLIVAGTPYCPGCIGYGWRPFSDINPGSLNLGGWLPVLIPGLLFFGWRNLREYRDTGELNAFTQSALWLIVFGGAWVWLGYFNGASLSWPVGIAALAAVLFLSRFAALARQRREHAEELQQFDKSAVHGNVQEATPDDERRAGL